MKVAIIHYWLVGMRGGEKVLEALCDLFPHADIFTHVYVPEAISEKIRRHRIETTFIANLPRAHKFYQRYLPLMPLALEQLDLQGYDLILSSESGPAKGVIPPPSAVHLCYCHSPMRYVWNMYHDYRARSGFFTQILMPPLAHYLRLWDTASAQRVDRFVANSRTTAARLRRYYGRDAAVIPPPVDVDAFEIVDEAERGDYLLMVGELVAYKRPELAVEACNRLKENLVVIGGGDMLDRIRQLAGPTVSVLGPRPFSDLRYYYARCRALLFPGEEDFGMVPVEAMASGRPVVAFARGGATETVTPNVSGVLFAEQTVEALIEAILACDALQFDPERIARQAHQFSYARFIERMRGEIENVCAARGFGVPAVTTEQQAAPIAGLENTEPVLSAVAAGPRRSAPSQICASLSGSIDQPVDAGRRVAERVRRENKEFSANTAQTRALPLEAGLTAQFARNSAFGSIFGLCTSAGSFLTTVIVAHALGVESTGRIAYALWIASVAAAVADLGVSAALARFLPECSGAGRGVEADSVAACLFRPLAGVGAAVLCGFVLYAGYQRHALGTGDNDSALWLIIGCTTALLTLAGFCYGRLRGMQRFDRLALLAVLSLGVQLAGVALGSILAGVVGALAGCCAGLVFPAVYCLFTLPKHQQMPDELRRRVYSYALYAWGGSLVSVFVWSRIEIFFLQHARGSEAVGLFSVSLTLSSLAVQGPVLLTAGLLPYFATSFGRGAFDEMRDAYATAVRVLAFLVMPACFGMAAIMPVALPLIYGSAFAGAVPSAIILLVAAGIAAMSSVGSSLIFAMERSDFIFVSGLLAAALSVLAGLTVVQSFGLTGAVWARAGVQLIAVALGCWFIIRRLHCPIPFRGLARIAAAAALCGAVARGSLLLPLGVASLPVAIAAGFVAYLLLSRLLRVLPAQDVERLRSLTRALPARLHALADRMLAMVFENPHDRIRAGWVAEESRARDPATTCPSTILAVRRADEY